jgi:hypothetical protein
MLGVFMNSILRIAFLFIILASFCYSQGVLKIETDKSSYTYGDSIKVSVIVSNNTDSSFSIWGSSTCIARIAFNNVQFEIACTADEREFKFPPHSSRTWVWELNPEVLGIPVKDGQQVIYGFCGGLDDSIKITAPKYYGGRLGVGFSTTASLKTLRDSLNVTVINSDTLNAINKIVEWWQINNYSIDSLVNIYKNDSRFQFIDAYRPLMFIDEFATSVNRSTVLPYQYSLSPNYPNPFNPTTVIAYSIPKSGNISLKIYDLLGREVATLVNEIKQAGNYEVKFDGSKLASGIYLYRIQSGNFNYTRKMILIK